MRTTCLILILLALLLCRCKDPYKPELEPTQTNFLVVEGFISNVNNGTQIRLSRSLPVYDSARLKLESRAQVTVESEDNTVYALQEVETGLYKALQSNLDPAKKYRLRIRTTDGGDYASDFLAIRQTPPLDVNWTREPDGVHITFSSEDPVNNLRYYKWNFEETWEIISPYNATYKYENDRMIERNPEEMRLMKRCWGRTFPNSIRLVSTVALAKDVIVKEPIIVIPKGDEKLSVRYSIIVKMQVLDKSAYEFFQLMKKNTESLGTLFDPQPSDISGNIRSLKNPKEKVIGFVLGSTLQEKRIFISRNELPNWGTNLRCVSIKVPNHPDSLQTFLNDGIIAHSADGMPPAIIDYWGTERHCADCRGRGNNVRPSFW